MTVADQSSVSSRLPWRPTAMSGDRRCLAYANLPRPYRSVQSLGVIYSLLKISPQIGHTDDVRRSKVVFGLTTQSLGGLVV